MTTAKMTAPCSDSSSPHPFDLALALHPLGEGRFVGRSPDAYQNMVGPYGGITAAMMLQALLLRPERLGDPIALTVNYAGPVPDGELEILTREIRTSRSTQHWVAEMRHGPDCNVSTTATAVFGTRRETWSHTESSAPQLPACEEVPSSRHHSSASWSARYERRMLNDLEAGETRGWLADDPPRPVDFPALASLCDAFRPWLFARRPEPTPIGTVTLNVYFHAGADELAEIGNAALQGRARTNAFHRGFFDQEAQLWSPDGRLLATAQQMVWFKT